MAGTEGSHERRYAPEYLEGTEHKRWAYRVRACPVPGCRNWMFPRQLRPGATCWEHLRRAPETAARVERLNAARQRRRATREE